ncbi:MAG: hypothetical protein WCF69_00025, partial [Mycobacterium sp.]
AKRPGAKKAAPAAQSAAATPQPEAATPEPETKAEPQAKDEPEPAGQDGETNAPATPVKGLGIARGARPPGKR